MYGMSDRAVVDNDLLFILECQHLFWGRSRLHMLPGLAGMPVDSRLGPTRCCRFGHLPGGDRNVPGHRRIPLTVLPTS